jgi:hypothetical protein
MVLPLEEGEKNNVFWKSLLIVDLLILSFIFKNWFCGVFDQFYIIKGSRESL